MLRRDVSQLAKLRHPRLLEIKTPLEETKESLMFVTEVVVASVANLTGKYDNILGGLPRALKDFSLTDVDRQLGLLQVAEGLNFLHKSARLLHGNLSLEALFVDGKGDWKIGGFGFSVHQGYSTTGDAEAAAMFSEFDQQTNTYGNPSLNYMAPERVLAPVVPSPVCESDLFSVGVIIYALWNDGRPVAENRNNILEYQHNLKAYEHPRLSALPLKLRDLASGLLSTKYESRPTAEDISANDYFDDVVMNSLQYMQNLVEKDAYEKSEFLQALPRIIPNIPERIARTKVLSHLLAELNNSVQVPYLLPCIFLLAQDMTGHEFREMIMPSLIGYQLFSMVDPPEVMIYLMENMDFLLQKSDETTIATHVLPMIRRALDVPSPELQEMCLVQIPKFAEKMDYSVFKNSILPKVCSLCLETDILRLRAKSLFCISKLLNIIDKWTVTERLIPTLEMVPSREPQVLMALMGVYYEMVKSKKLSLDVEMVSGRILPFLAPMCTDRGLNAAQFKTFMSALKSMIIYIERERGAKLNDHDKSVSKGGSGHVPNSQSATRGSGSRGTDQPTSETEDQLKTKLWAQLNATKAAGTAVASGTGTAPTPSTTPRTTSNTPQRTNTTPNRTTPAPNRSTAGPNKTPTDTSNTSTNTPAKAASGRAPSWNTSGPSAYANKNNKQGTATGDTLDSLTPHTHTPIHTRARAPSSDTARQSADTTTDSAGSRQTPSDSADGVDLLLQQQNRRRELTERKKEQQRRLREQQQDKPTAHTRTTPRPDTHMLADGWQLSGPPASKPKVRSTTPNRQTSTSNPSRTSNSSDRQSPADTDGWGSLVGSTNTAAAGRDNSQMNSGGSNSGTGIASGSITDSRRVSDGWGDLDGWDLVGVPAGTSTTAVTGGSTYPVATGAYGSSTSRRNSHGNTNTYGQPSHGDNTGEYSFGGNDNRYSTVMGASSASATMNKGVSMSVGDSFGSFSGGTAAASQKPAAFDQAYGRAYGQAAQDAPMNNTPSSTQNTGGNAFIDDLLG